MKKKILLVTFMVAILVCVFAISVSASVSTAYDKTEKVTVTLTNGTQECALYDADGDELVWYTLDGGATVTSIKTKDLTITYSGEGKSLERIYLDADKQTCLQRIGEKTFNCIVVANLRGLTFTTLPNQSYIGLFEDSAIVQYVYLPVTIASIECNHFLRATSMKVCDFPEDARYAFVNSNVFNGASALEEINLAGLTSVKGSQHFIGCTSLKRVIGFEKSTITSLSEKMFQNCGLLEIAIPNTVTTVGLALFYGCSDLETVSFGAELTTLGKYDAVKLCPSLKTVYMPATVTTIPAATFEGANNVEVIFYTGGYDLTKAFQASAKDAKNTQTHILEFTLISAGEYEALTDKSGKYIVYDYSECEAFYNDNHSISSGACTRCGKTVYCDDPNHNLKIDISYENYSLEGTKSTICLDCDSAPLLTKAPALFTNLGFSAAQYGDSVMSVNYRVNEEAIKAYEEITGVSINYGVFAAMKDNVGNNDIFDENGDALKGVIAADITESGFDLFNLKIFGFTEAQKEIDLAIGAYVGTTKDGATEYSYLQIAPATAGEKYFFASYNKVLTMLPDDDEVA